MKPKTTPGAAGAGRPEALVGAGFVSEAASEDLELKQALFSRMEESVDVETILASNTSTHPMTHIAELMKHPARAIVTHPFNPPHNRQRQFPLPVLHRPNHLKHS